MSVWKDEYKVRWPAELRRRYRRERELGVYNAMIKREYRKSLTNRILNYIYYIMITGIIISVIWFVFLFVGVIPG